MTKIKPVARTREPLLQRTQTVFEFDVRYPHGTTAINGYRRAAHHFRLHTREDPRSVGSDTCCLWIHREAQLLRAAATRLNAAYATGDESQIEDAESWLMWDSGVHWFDHDWKYWDIEQDEGALETLGWRRSIIELGSRMRVTLTKVNP